MFLSDAWQWLTTEILTTKWFLPFITAAGGIITFCHWRVDKKYDRRNVELLNIPDFRLFDFCRGTSIQESLSLNNPCSEPIFSPRQCNYCGDVHWFNIQYTGKVAIRNFSVALLSERDTSNLPIIISRRLIKRFHVAPYTVIQYKLPIDEIREYKSQKLCFSVLIEYQSEYSKIKYKQIYHLCASNKDDNSNTRWPYNLDFYSSYEETICRNNWYKFFKKLSAYIRYTLNIRYSIEKNWINDFWHKK